MSIGESWEISGVPGHISQVNNGALQGIDLQTLMDVRSEDIVGRSLFDAFGHQFPLLIKYINTSDILSVQVHPDDAEAKRRHGCLGKTEMWYILEAGEGASIIDGLSRTLSRQEMSDMIRKGRIREVLRSVHPAPGDVFYIPGRRVHAIGKNIVLAEIQETSDITYRLYDWDRNQPDRPLHVEEALDVLDYSETSEFRISNPESQIPNPESQIQPLVHSPHFTTNRLDLTKDLERNFPQEGNDSFVIYMCAEGSVSVECKGPKHRGSTIGNPELLVKGDTLLVPACINNVSLSPCPSASVLEIYVAK